MQGFRVAPLYTQVLKPELEHLGHCVTIFVDIVTSKVDGLALPLNTRWKLIHCFQECILCFEYRRDIVSDLSAVSCLRSGIPCWKYS